MKIVLLAATALSLGVAVAYADNEGSANTTIHADHPGGCPDVRPPGYPRARDARCSCCSAKEGLAAGWTVDPALLTVRQGARVDDAEADKQATC